MTPAQPLDDLNVATKCVVSDPDRSLAICQSYLATHPDDPHGLFCRFQALEELGDFENARTDIDRVIELDPKWVSYFARGVFFHNSGHHASAVDDLTCARRLDVEGSAASGIAWYRADSLARLGRLDEALADCKLLAEDHWTPGQNGLPAGNKQEFTAEIRRRAFLALKRKTGS